MLFKTALVVCTCFGGSALAFGPSNDILCTYSCDVDLDSTTSVVVQGVDTYDCPNNPYPSCSGAYIRKTESCACSLNQADFSANTTGSAVHGHSKGSTETSDCQVYSDVIMKPTPAKASAQKTKVRQSTFKTVTTNAVVFGLKACAKDENGAPLLLTEHRDILHIAGDVSGTNITGHDLAACLVSVGVNELIKMGYTAVCAELAPEDLPVCKEAFQFLLKLPLIQGLVNTGKKIITSVVTTVGSVVSHFFHSIFIDLGIDDAQLERALKALVRFDRL